MRPACDDLSSSHQSSRDDGDCYDHHLSLRSSMDSAGETREADRQQPNQKYCARSRVAFSATRFPWMSRSSKLRSLEGWTRVAGGRLSVVERTPLLLLLLLLLLRLRRKTMMSLPSTVLRAKGWFQAPGTGASPSMTFDSHQYCDADEVCTCIRPLCWSPMPDAHLRPCVPTCRHDESIMISYRVSVPDRRFRVFRTNRNLTTNQMQAILRPLQKHAF